MLTAVDRDVSTNWDTILLVLPLADVGWTFDISVNTLVDTIATYLIIISTPGAVTVFVQMVAITVPVDWRPLVLLSSGLIAAKILWIYLSWCSGGGQCD